MGRVIARAIVAHPPSATKPGSRFTLPNPTMRPSPTHPPHTAVNADRLIARIAMMSPHGLRSGPSPDRGSVSPVRCASTTGPVSPNPDRAGSPAASTRPDWSTSSRTTPPDRSTRPVALPGPPDRSTRPAAPPGPPDQSTTPEEDPGPDRSATPARAVDRTRPPDSVRASTRSTGPVFGPLMLACATTPDRSTTPSTSDWSAGPPVHPSTQGSGSRRSSDGTSPSTRTSPAWAASTPTAASWSGLVDCSPRAAPSARSAPPDRTTGPDEEADWPPSPDCWTGPPDWTASLDRPRPDEEADRSTPSVFRTGPPDCSPDCSPDRSTAPDRTASAPDCWTAASDRSASSSGSNRTASAPDCCFRSRYSRSSRDARDPPQPNSDISWLRPGSTPNRSSNAAISSNATSSDIGTVVDAMMVLPLSVGGGPPVWSPRATFPSFSVTM